MKFTHFVFIVILSNLAMSCKSDQLSRDKATELIKAFYQYPNLVTRTIHLDMFMNTHKELISAGYMHYSNGKYYLTPETDEFLVGDEPNRVACATEEFKEITGIQFTNEAKTSAAIEYTCVITNLTPFGTIHKMTEGKTETHRVVAEKYDDGWRINSTKQKVYKMPVESFNMSVGTPCTLTEDPLATFRQDGIRFDLHERIVKSAEDSETQVVVQRKFKGKCEEIYHMDGYRGFDVKDFNEDGYQDLIQLNRRGQYVIVSLYNKETKTFEESGIFGPDRYKPLSDNFNYTITLDASINARYCNFFNFDKLKQATTATMTFNYMDYTTLETITVFKVKGDNEILIDSIPQTILQDLNKKGQLVLEASAGNYRSSLNAFIEKYWAENKSKLK